MSNTKPTVLLSKNRSLASNGLMFIIILLFTVSCGGGKHNDPKPLPAQATLSFPEKDALCTSGTVISPTETTVILTWNASANTDSYDVVIKNLLTSTSTTQLSATNQKSLTLLRNTPYSWYVVSKSNSVTATAQSDTWKFYVAGLGSTNYSPFPATLISPAFGQTISGAKTANLVWNGNDVDNDIATYDVYFGTSTSPPLLQSNVANEFLNSITVAANTTYYWKIVTKDAQSNTSVSEIYQFKVN
jgi:hypothetical protein